MDIASEIQSLVSTIQTLEPSVARWNTARLVFVGAAAFVAAALAVTSVVAARRGSALAQAQAELNRLKDVRLTGILAGKDVEIGRANRSASEAAEKAESARAQTVKLEIAAAAQRERAANAEKSLLELQEKLAWRNPSPEQAGSSPYC